MIILLPALLIFWAVVWLALLILFRLRKPRWVRRQKGGTSAPEKTPQNAFPQPKPAWVADTVLRMHAETKASHRQLAKLFNRHYFAKSGISVGRTWVRELLMAHEHRRMQVRAMCKNRIPEDIPKNALWALDASFVRAENRPQQILAALDHGTRLNVMLEAVPKLNAWTFLGHIFLCVGKYGKPSAIRTDNGPAFRAKLVRNVLRLAGIKQQFSQPGKPWQNGRIERFFGMLKHELRGFKVEKVTDFQPSLDQFRAWYNQVRPHQHLHGKTPAEAWQGVDFLRQAATSVEWFCAWGGQLRGYVLRC